MFLLNLKSEMMKKLYYFLSAILIITISCKEAQKKKTDSLPEKVTLTKEQLLDKIKGGWAGQTIGCTYGGHTEFRYNGTMIQDYVKIEWNDTIVKWWYDNIPGIYDDVYMDATFVKVFDRLGLDAPADSFATAFATAEYPLWHANQTARYNLLNGIKAPESGHWKNNFHAEDIDFQIEADFAGLMTPGMINSGVAICDKIGHIMNYGDGYYGGVYVSAMYSLAFISDDIELIVNEALKVIPAESTFHQCMSDVIKYHKQYPADWKQTWFEMQRKWTEDAYCGVFDAFNIEAKINCAYILIGLLYGEKDFTKTMDISTRCGYDSDCNPASAAGILGTMIGYKHIPQTYLTSLKQAEDIDFAHTHASLNDIYTMSYNQALAMIKREGGSISDNAVEIKVQSPQTIPLEVSFAGLYPTKQIKENKPLTGTKEITFEGKGIIFNGWIKGDKNYVAKVKLFIDGQLAEEAELPADFRTRRNEISYKFDIPYGKHTATLKWENPEKGAEINITDILIYSDEPPKK